MTNSKGTWKVRATAGAWVLAERQGHLALGFAIGPLEGKEWGKNTHFCVSLPEAIRKFQEALEKELAP